MAAPTITVQTEVGTFKRQTWNQYLCISVVDGIREGHHYVSWHYSIQNARKSLRRYDGLWLVGIFDLEGNRLQGPSIIGATYATVDLPKAPKPAPAYEFPKCDECDRRHDPARRRCFGCWKCHEVTAPCKWTKADRDAVANLAAVNGVQARPLSTAWTSLEQMRASR